MTNALTRNKMELSIPEELQSFLKENASVGSENLGGASLPQLKITESNSKNELEDGQYAPTGEFYYSPDKTTHKELTVSIMSISRGFYALDNSKDPKPKFTQLLGGMIINTGKPFVMFVSGTRLQKMWDFAKQIRPLTKGKAAIPMFALKAKLTLERIDTEYGMNHVVNYSLVKEDGMIQILGDMDALQMVRSNVDMIEEMFAGFIEQKEVDKETGEPIRQEDKFIHESVSQISGNDVEMVKEVLGVDVVEANQDDDISDEIPF